MADDRVQAITPRYRTESPNTAVPLATGPVTLQQGEASETLASGAVSFEWLPLVGVVVNGGPPYLRFGAADVTSGDVSIKGDFRVVKSGSAGTQAVSDGDVHINHSRSRSPRIDFVDIHVANLPHIQGDAVWHGNRSISGRQEWDFGQWHMTMDPIFYPKGLEAAAKASRGNLLTHVIRAERADSKPFRAKHLEPLLDSLQLALSFAFGDHAGPMLAAGTTKNGNVVLELIRPYPSFGWRPRFGPAPVYTGIGPMMQSLSTIFENADEILRETVWWHLEASWAMIEASVVLSQASLERLAYHHLVTTTGMLLDEAYDKLSAADNIRLMMRALGIPTDSGVKGADIPSLITRARNDQVHARRKGKGVAAEAARPHCLQTIDLVMLRLAGYAGAHHPREARHVGDELPVPWAATELGHSESP